MDRSTKHSPRVDDQLKHETEALVRGAPVEARVEEDREQEAPADGEPTATVFPEREEFYGLGADAPTARRELSRHLGLHAFPATKQSLLERAEAEFAPEAVLQALRALPDDREFHTVYDVADALGLHAEERAPAGRHAPPDADRPVA
jgi:hypothetical protein